MSGVRKRLLVWYLMLESAYGKSRACCLGPRLQDGEDVAQGNWRPVSTYPPLMDRRGVLSGDPVLTSC
ncbi:hypothetical protein E2C01_066384 [Portunus trituberculatus]|uniref:Secreted protein n=1 Tax=Portunus trituberculatus TaxID=210409 RepID=A0A5B7HGX3_PORTR|nr:hypothetical protein [Portunus trituberculatus]